MPAIVHIGSASDCGHIFSCHKISAFRKSLKDGVYRTDTNEKSEARTNAMNLLEAHGCGVGYV